MTHAGGIDVRGLSLSAASSAAVERFDALIDDLYYYRLGVMDRLDALLLEFPEFGLAHVLRGYSHLTDGTLDAHPKARAELLQAQALPANPRERLHQEALRAWLADDLSARAGAWEQILVDLFRGHLWWHLSLFKISQSRFDEALDVIGPRLRSTCTAQRQRDQRKQHYPTSANPCTDPQSFKKDSDAGDAQPLRLRPSRFADDEHQPDQRCLSARTAHCRATPLIRAVRRSPNGVPMPELSTRATASW